MLTVLVAILIFAGSYDGARAGEETPISLKPGMPPDGAWPVVERYMRGTDEGEADDLNYTLDEYVKRGWAKDRKEALVRMLREDVHWGYADLDDDGANEMLVWLGVIGWCGSAGCPTPVLRRGPTGWGIVDELTLLAPKDALCLDQTGPKGFPMIRTQSDALWWTGQKFDWVCYFACDGWGKPYELSGEFLVGLTAEKLQLIGELRQRPWCAPETAN